MKSIKQAVEEYIHYRCSLGFKLRQEQATLRNFAFFMTNLGATHITNKLAKMFAKLNPNASRTQWARNLTIIARFARYWIYVDPHTEIPTQCFGSSSFARKAPYIYSDDEITRILQYCQKSCSAHEIERYSYFTWFGLIIVTGMRPGEIVRLDRNDVNLTKGIIAIRDSKCKKSRHIPLHHSTTQAIKNYLEYCDRHIPKPKTSRLFINHLGTPLSIDNVREIFRRILGEIGIQRSPQGRPRIMDFRHSFAVHHLIRWYKRHVNIDQYIPLLSTYLGHSHLRYTYWYVSMTPQLLKYVALCCEDYERGLL